MKTDKKWIGEGLKPNSVNCNVLNVLRTLIEDSNAVVYIPDGYKKGSSSTSSDPKVHFYPTESGRRIEVTSIGSNQERFNFSLTGLVNVLVEDKLTDGTVRLVPKKVYRQYNIIRDGKLMLDYIIAQLDPESFCNLRDAGILYYNGVKVPETHCHNSEFLYKVMLKDIPVISLNWAQPINIGLYEMMKEEEYLVQSNKLLRARIKELKSQGYYVSVEEDTDIYVESTTTTSSSSKESYDAECIVYSLPEISKSDLIEEEVKEHINNLGMEYCSDALKSSQKRLRELRFMSRCVIMAIENSKKQGSYNWSELAPVPRSKNKMRQEATVDVNGELIKLRREVYTKTIKL